MRHGIRAAAIALSIGWLACTPTPALAQSMVCTANGRSCDVWEEADLRAAAADPVVEEIVLMTDIELTEGEEDSLYLADSTDGGVRLLVLRSDTDEPGMSHALWLDGMGTCLGALVADGACSVTPDSVTVKRFTLGNEEVMGAPNVLFWGGSPALEIRHCRFEDTRQGRTPCSDTSSSTPEAPTSTR